MRLLSAAYSAMSPVDNLRLRSSVSIASFASGTRVLASLATSSSSSSDILRYRSRKSTRSIMASGLFEKQGRDVVQVVAPDGPFVAAFAEDECVIDTGFGEDGIEGADVGSDEGIVFADADPENFELLVHKRRILKHFRVLLLGGGTCGRAHHHDVAEEFGAIERDVHGLAAAHGEAADCSVVC